MPDYSMCLNKSCPRRYNCARYMMKPNAHRQSYMSYEAATCDSFWPVSNCGYPQFTIAEITGEEEQYAAQSND